MLAIFPLFLKRSTASIRMSSEEENNIKKQKESKKNNTFLFYLRK